MKNKGLIAIAIYLIMMFIAGFGFGCIVNKEKYEELKGINNNLYHVIQNKDKAYYELEQMMIEYRWKLESCYQQIGDMQDDPDVNNDGVVNSLDLLVLQQYILNQDNG